MALFALFSSLAIGTMPLAKENGIEVVLCTGAGPLTVMIGADGEPIEPSHQLCDWAGVAGDQSLASPEFAFEDAHLVAFVALRSDVPTRAGRRLGNPNHVRGPPTLL